jgi:hypothetical protein
MVEPRPTSKPRSFAAAVLALCGALTPAPAAVAQTKPALTAPGEIFGGAPTLRPSSPPTEATLPAGPAPVSTGAPDSAFAAYQRGYHLTAYAEALKRLKADPSDAAAMALIGQLHREGLSVKPDEREAALWMKLAADRGDLPAIFALAVMTLDGKGTPKDAEAARRLFEQAAAKGHPGALYNLGVMAVGREPPDFKAAADYFRKSAEAGDPDGAYSLALLYREGRGVERDVNEAARWMEFAADERNLAAEIEYALMLFNGVGVDKNEPAAARLFARAANRDNPSAQNRLARILAAGRGAPKNQVEAMKWHILARAGGVEDKWLDDQLATLTPEQRQKVDLAVRRYLAR